MRSVLLLKGFKRTKKTNDCGTPRKRAEREEENKKQGSPLGETWVRKRKQKPTASKKPEGLFLFLAESIRRRALIG